MNTQAVAQAAIHGSSGPVHPADRPKVDITLRLAEGRPLPAPEVDALKEGDFAQTVAGLNSFMETIDKELHFTYHEDAGRMMVEVIDRQTEEVVRTFPPKELLDLAARIGEMVGMFLDQRS